MGAMRSARPGIRTPVLFKNALSKCCYYSNSIQIFIMQLVIVQNEVTAGNKNDYRLYDEEV
jgi:hypothetical protein